MFGNDETQPSERPPRIFFRWMGGCFNGACWGHRKPVLCMVSDGGGCFYLLSILDKQPEEEPDGDNMHWNLPGLLLVDAASWIGSGDDDATAFVRGCRLGV